MKILTAEQLREADQYTITHKTGTSDALMEIAARACYHWILEHLKDVGLFYIFCGTGNNGGDGLALARMLSLAGRKTKVFIIRPGNKESKDFSENLIRLKKIKGVQIEEWTEENYKDSFHIFKNSVENEGLIIDAIIGSGLNKKLSGWLSALIKQINDLKVKILSIDIPTGLFADDNSQNDLNYAIQANYTLTFQCPKLSFLLPSSGNLVGYFSVLDIGLDETFINNQKSNYYFITADSIKHFLKPRNKFSHKGTFGHALLMAGSKGMMGAAILASRSAIRTGTGLLTVHIPACGYELMQTSIPEAIVIADKNEIHLTENNSFEKYSAIGIGPGIGIENETVQLLKRTIQNAACPLVLDADALNILSENKTWLSFLPAECILTPHPKEFERLAGKSEDDTSQMQLLRNFSVKYQVYVVLKGAYTRIATPTGTVFFNATGNPGLAKGGSGDVLTGMFTSLLAQGYSPLQSALAGVFLHGLAADIALQKIAVESMMASDIIDNISEAFREINHT